MGLVAVLLDKQGHQVHGLPDPAGGTFDAAGDFDRLLGPVAGAPLWSSLDPYGDTDLSADEVTALAAELPLLTALARQGPEQRGLGRLAALLAAGQDSGQRVQLLGD